MAGNIIESIETDPNIAYEVLVTEARANSVSTLPDKVLPIIGTILPTAIFIDFFVKLSEDFASKDCIEKEKVKIPKNEVISHLNIFLIKSQRVYTLKSVVIIPDNPKREYITTRGTITFFDII